MLSPSAPPPRCSASAGSRFNGVVIAALAWCALLLTALGIYAVLSCVVTERRMEIGLRMAMGATPARVARLFVTDALGATLCGALAGFAAAAWLRDMLSKLLFGIEGIDLAAYSFAALALTVVAIAASIVPSWRVAATDPARALQAR